MRPHPLLLHLDLAHSLFFSSTDGQAHEEEAREGGVARDGEEVLEGGRGRVRRRRSVEGGRVRATERRHARRGMAETERRRARGMPRVERRRAGLSVAYAGDPSGWGSR
jgi:hypothetical protein